MASMRACRASQPDFTGNFGNVRTITIPGNTVTVTCSPTPGPAGDVYTVGDGTLEGPLASVTIFADSCKPGEYVFESWVDTNGEQQVVFHPNFPPTGTPKPLNRTSSG